VQNSLDYAENSRQLRRHLQKTREVLTPVILTKADAASVREFKNRFGIADEDRVLGLAGRVAAEKGYEYLIEAMPRVLERFPTARVIHAGSWKGVVGEEEYQKRIEEMSRNLGDRWRSLGFLSDEDFRAFFGACDVLVFSSLNSTESFGIVQIEAMLQGAPVVATDMPGVRQPVLRTGFGRLVPPRDAEKLAEAICSVLEEGRNARPIPEAYLARFGCRETALSYQTILETLTHV
jgi:glycosyltransferase involved in cell wall biosynthesis